MVLRQAFPDGERRAPQMLAEAFPHMAVVEESAAFRNFLVGKARIVQKLHGAVHPETLQKMQGTFPVGRLKQKLQFADAHSRLLRQFADGKGAVAEVFRHRGDDPAQIPGFRRRVFPFAVVGKQNGQRVQQKNGGGQVAWTQFSQNPLKRGPEKIPAGIKHMQKRRFGKGQHRKRKLEIVDDIVKAHVFGDFRVGVLHSGINQKKIAFPQSAAAVPAGVHGMPVRKEDKLGEIVGVRRRDGRMQIAVPGHERHGQRITCLVDEFVQVQFQHGGVPSAG